MVADVASTSDITEAFLAQALSGKLAGADTSDSSTIRNMEVTVVSSGPGSSGNAGQANDNDGGVGSSYTLDYSNHANSASSRLQNGGRPSSTQLLPESNLMHAPSLISSNQSILSPQFYVPLEFSRYPRMLANTDRVNVSFHVVGRLSFLGYQNADAFEVCMLS